MESFFVGSPVVGNFKLGTTVSGHPAEEYKIVKIDGSLELIACTEKSGNKLIPLDDTAIEIVSEFSETSIYQIEQQNGSFVVVLYRCGRVMKVSSPMWIYLTRDLQKEICSVGISGLHCNTDEDIPKLLEKTFIQNKSIFIQFKQNSDIFTMYGNNFIRAIVKKERTGVYVIQQLHRVSNTVSGSVLTQVYDTVKYTDRNAQHNIQFILWRDSFDKENTVAYQLAPQISDVFKAWEQYMDFQQRKYEQDFKIIDCREVKIKNNKPYVTFVREQNFSQEENNKEYEFISDVLIGENPRPKTLDELTSLRNKLKQETKEVAVFMGKAYKDVWEPSVDMPPEYIGKGGIMYVSNRSLNIEQNRRKWIIQQLKSMRNQSANIIMRLSAPNTVDYQFPLTDEPVNADVLKKVFGNPNFKIKEDFREALSIALNTPDIALIQGPPGTGKTTLIKMLVTRLNSRGKSCNILVSSEQHEALGNVIGRLSVNTLLPPFISSKKFGQTGERENLEISQKNVADFQNHFIDLCQNILKQDNNISLTSNYSNNIVRIGYLLQKIREQNYSVSCISETMKDIEEILVHLQYRHDLGGQLSDIRSVVDNANKQFQDKSFYTQRLFSLIEYAMQFTELEQFNNQAGMLNLKQIQQYLQKSGYDARLAPEKLITDLESGEESVCANAFVNYLDYIKQLHSLFQRISEKTDDNAIKVAVENLADAIYKKTQEIPNNFLDIVEQLYFRLQDTETVAETVKRYTPVIGSTCAQARKSLEYTDTSKNNFDYVIIDEASHANPLDVMIPMMFGIHVILVGDQRQLPHYIEQDVVNCYRKERDKYAEFDESLLKKSLFQLMFENLEKAYKDGRLRCKRCTMLNEQHRMHPVIGDFISKEFYKGGLHNAMQTSQNLNDYGICNSKNVAWIDVPMKHGEETSEEHSYCRESEIEQIKLILTQLIRNGYNNEKTHVGIITFYKLQQKKLEVMIKKEFGEEMADVISVNTVDSCQGKEFDIVILSGVRCNRKETPESSLGFIQHCDSRINVALSRAKKLLIIVADKDTFGRNEHFRNLIKYVEDVGYNDKY